MKAVEGVWSGIAMTTRSQLGFESRFAHRLTRPRRAAAARRLVARIGLWAVLSAPACADTVSWTTHGDGDWSTPANWSNQKVPGISDDVTIDVDGATVRTISLAGGTYYVNTLNSQERLATTGAWLRASGNTQITGGLSVSGSGSVSCLGNMAVSNLDWSGGWLNSGVWTLNGTATVHPTSSAYFHSTDVRNAGILNWSSGDIGLDSTKFTNQASGTFNISADATLGSAGTFSTVANAGILNKSAAAGTTTIINPFTNTGQININSGTLLFNGGITSSGPVTVADGATLKLGWGTQAFNTGAKISGAGGLSITGGTVTLADTVNIAGGFSMSGDTPTVTVSSQFNNTGPFTLTKGSVSFSGWTTAASLGSTVTATNGSITLATGKAVSAGSLSLANASLTLNDTLTVAGPVSIDATSSLGGSSKLVATTGFSLNASGLSAFTGEITTGGPSGWTAATVNLGNGARITVLPGATLNTTTQGDFGNNNTQTLNNGGTLLCAATGGVSTRPVFNNTGAVSVTGGTLTFANGGTHSGPFSVAAGATLAFNGATQFNAGSDIQSAGAVQFQGTATVNSNLNISGSLSTNATLNVNAAYNNTGSLLITGNTMTLGPTTSVTSLASSITTNGGFLALGTGKAYSVSALNMLAGGLHLNDPLTVTGSTSLNVGTIDGTGPLNISGTLVITRPWLYTTLNNSAQATWGTGDMQFSSSAVFNNLAGATLVDSADHAINPSSSAGVFNNAGSYSRTAGSGATTINSVFNNSGNISVTSGGLTLAGGGQHSGSIYIGQGCNVTLNQRLETYPTVFNSGAALAGTGTLNLATYLTLNTPMSFSGNVNWTYGNITGPGALDIGGNLTMQPTSSLRLASGATLNVAGATTWPGGSYALTSDANSLINVLTGGTFLIAGDSTISGVINAGTLTKSAGTGTTSLSAFTNTGTVNHNAGTLVIGSRGTAHTGNFNIAPGATLKFSNGATTSATSRISGNALQLDSGSYDFSGPIDVSSLVLSNGASAIVRGGFRHTGALTLGGNLTFLSGATIDTLGSSITVSSGRSLSLGTGQALSTGALTMQSGTTLYGSGSLTATGLTTLAGTTIWHSGALNAVGGMSISGLTCSGNGTINNSGVANWLSGAISGVGTFNNLAGATFNDNIDGFKDSTAVLSGMRFNNAGIFNYSPSNSFFAKAINCPFDNSGTVNVVTGTMTLTGTGAKNYGGTFNIASGKSLYLSGTNQTFVGTCAFTGAGTVYLNNPAQVASGAMVSAAVPITQTSSLTLMPGSRLTTSANYSASATIGGAGAFSVTGGTTSITGAQQWLPGASLAIDHASLNMQTDAGSAAAWNLGITAGPGAAAIFRSRQHLASLIVSGATAKLQSGGQNMLLLNTLGIDSMGTLDIADNAADIDYTGTSPYNALRQLVLAGSIFTSVNHPTTGTTATVVPIDNAAARVLSWKNETISDGLDFTQLLLVHTYLGDVNLDGLVDSVDAALALAGIGRTAASWLDGDINLDGGVTQADYDLVLANLGAGVTTGAPLKALSDSIRIVPEPCSLALLLTPGLMLVLQRRRHT